MSPFSIGSRRDRSELVEHPREMQRGKVGQNLVKRQVDYAIAFAVKKAEYS